MEVEAVKDMSNHELLANTLVAQDEYISQLVLQISNLKSEI